MSCFQPLPETVWAHVPPTKALAAQTISSGRSVFTAGLSFGETANFGQDASPVV
jgi:hypothetical protein